MNTLNKKSLISLLLSFLSLVLPFILVNLKGTIFILGILICIVSAIAGGILSYKAIVEIKISKEKGHTIAILAMICSIISIYRLLIITKLLSMDNLEGKWPRIV